jgi:hypothetical protein
MLRLLAGSLSSPLTHRAQTVVKVVTAMQSQNLEEKIKKDFISRCVEVNQATNAVWFETSF